MIFVRWMIVLSLCSVKTALAENHPLSYPNQPVPPATNSFADYTLGYISPLNAALQANVEGIDSRLREQYGIATNQTAVGLLDLNNLRLAMIRPDHEEYGASIPKIGILLAYFQLHPQAATNLDASTRHDLGLMIKVSSNEKAAQFSRQLGLKQIQQILND